MKKLHNIRRRLLKQMAFSVFVMAVLPLSTRTANSRSATPVARISNAGHGHSDFQPEPGKCVALRSTSNQ